MFESLSSRLGEVFDQLKRRGVLRETDVTTAMREVRLALLEADVALEVVRSFIEQVRERAIGQDVIRSVTPGQQVVKIVHDSLVEMLGSEAVDFELNAVPPVSYLMVGLQGGGKTTTTAKIAARLTGRDKKKVMMASLDIYRPAAREQLKVLGEQTGISTLPIATGEAVISIVKRAMTVARLQGFDVLLLDTAGRISIDSEMMAEVREIHDMVNPVETLLVADAMTGQDAVNTARNFHEQIGLTGIVLTRMDGDARGGAALSMRAVTGVPIKAIGTGEKTDALKAFHPERVAGSILGMGDVVSLVEKVSGVLDEEEVQRTVARLQQGEFDFNLMLTQLQQLTQVGGVHKMLEFIPGMGKLQKQAAATMGMDDAMIRRQIAIIQSMTKAERRQPKILKASRKRRIATGSGTTVQAVNMVLRQQMQTARMMKQAGKSGGLDALAGGAGSMTPAQLLQGMAGGRGSGRGRVRMPRFRTRR